MYMSPELQVHEHFNRMVILINILYTFTIVISIDSIII